MSDTFGMPGPGGSLGTCAVCGKPFLTELILGRTVSTFQITASYQTFYAHTKCLPLVKDGMDWKDLPAESPLRAAFEAATAKRLTPNDNNQ